MKKQQVILVWVTAAVFLAALAVSIATKSGDGISTTECTETQRTTDSSSEFKTGSRQQPHQLTTINNQLQPPVAPPPEALTPPERPDLTFGKAK